MIVMIVMHDVGIDAHRGGDEVGGGGRVNIIPPSGKFKITC
jgi:hypothetical protein